MHKKRIIFMGTPRYAAGYLEGLIAAGIKPIAVITQPDRPAGREQIIEPTSVKQVATAHDIPVYQPNDIREPEWTATIRELAPDFIIVVAFGQIIPQSILDIPSKGCINVHPSLLPRHRGATPWQETILQGDTKTGVTIMLMDEKMDHGPILAQEEIDVASNETTRSLEDKTAKIGIPLLIKIVHIWTEENGDSHLFCKEEKSNQYKKGGCPHFPREQTHEHATYTRLLKKESGKIDWSKSAIEIERMIRALNPWPGTWTEWRGKRVKILRSHINENSILIIDELQPEGKKPMERESFINGYIQKQASGAGKFHVIPSPNDEESQGFQSVDAGFLAALGMTSERSE